MIPLKIVNHTELEVEVSLSPEGLVFKVGDLYYTNERPDTDALNRAVVYTDPFKFNQAHTNRVIDNIEYVQGGGLVRAVLAGEFVVQRVPYEQASGIRELTEQTIISMEEYRQYRCHKTLLTYCEKELGGHLEAARYLSNYNVTSKIETPQGTVVIVGCGMTLEKRNGNWEMRESMITSNSDGHLSAGFVFMPLHVFKAIDTQLGTYIVRGSQ